MGMGTPHQGRGDMGRWWQGLRQRGCSGKPLTQDDMLSRKHRWLRGEAAGSPQGADLPQWCQEEPGCGPIVLKSPWLLGGNSKVGKLAEK